MTNLLKNIAEFFTPTLTSSHFREKGVLTPEEFVQAGDLLVSRCPTWRWESGEKSKRKSYLPDNKQYLETQNVPCAQRATELLNLEDDEESLHGDDDGWTSTFVSHTSEKESETLELGTMNNEEEEDDVPDLEDFTDDNLVVEDEAAVVSGEIVKTRRYNISITYDKYYQTPRVFLIGFNENGEPLKPDPEILEDVYAEYAKKTVTIESHPHVKIPSASIHPCRHAAVMKKMVDELEDPEEGRFVRVDLYLFLFLKFISAVIPTINYDFTMRF